MTLTGTIRNGRIIPDEAAASLPEGASVRIEILLDAKESLSATGPTLADTLRPAIGKAGGLPTDAARNYRHYLYGTPKAED